MHVLLCTPSTSFSGMGEFIIVFLTVQCSHLDSIFESSRSHMTLAMSIDLPFDARLDISFHIPTHEQGGIVRSEALAKSQAVDAGRGPTFRPQP